MRFAVCSALSLILFSVGCATAPPPVTYTDEADAVRARRALADNDFERALITEELASIEIERARSANTVFAYRRFLAEFPIGREATTARTLLEALRFQEAKAEDTPLAWQIFLAEHSDGPHATEARQRLGSLAVDQVAESGDLTSVREVLARFPGHPRRDELVALEDKLAFEHAKSGELADVETYLAEHALGSYRVEALDLREKLEREAILASADLERARRRAAADPSGKSDELIDELLLNRALATLDLDALGKLAKDAAPPVRERAAAHLTALQREPLSSSMRDAVSRARPAHGLRSLDALAQVLRNGDPLDRQAALREAVEYASWEAANLVLDAVESRYVGVRLASVESLRQLKTAMPEAWWRGFAERREREALFNALTAEPWRRIAAIRDAEGRIDLALAAWREVLRYDPDDLAAGARVLNLTQLSGDRLGVGAAARNLATTAALFGDGRWLKPHDPATPAMQRRDGPGTTVGVPAEVTVLRQLCSAMALTKQGREALSSLRSGSQATELQLYTLAISDADRSIARMVTRRAELEREAARRGYPACDVDLVSKKLAKAHSERVEAISVLAQSGDGRLLPFVTRLQHTPSQAVRDAAVAAVRVLSRDEKAPAAIESR